MFFIIEVQKGKSISHNKWVLDILDTSDWTIRRIGEDDYRSLYHRGISIFPSLIPSMRDMWKAYRYGYLESYGDIHFLTLHDVHYQGSETFTDDIDMNIFSTANNSSQGNTYREVESTFEESTSYTMLFYKSRCILMSNIITGQCIVLPIKTGILATIFCYTHMERKRIGRCYLDFETGELIDLMYMYTECHSICRDNQSEYGILSEFCGESVMLYVATTRLGTSYQPTFLSRYHIVSSDMLQNRFRYEYIQLSPKSYAIETTNRADSTTRYPYIDLTAQIQIEAPKVANQARQRVANLINDFDTDKAYLLSWIKENEYIPLLDTSPLYLMSYQTDTFKCEVRQLLLDYINHKEWNNMESIIKHYKCANVLYDLDENSNSIVLKIQDFKQLWYKTNMFQTRQEYYNHIPVVSIKDKWWRV